AGDGAGCGCAAGGNPSPGVLAGVLGLLGLVRRRQAAGDGGT
ncbi:MAG: MYXO-CTERM sorting domain-containing protein, partial [Deltaproteobacteria bacterium]